MKCGGYNNSTCKSCTDKQVSAEGSNYYSYTIYDEYGNLVYWETFTSDSMPQERNFMPEGTSGIVFPNGYTINGVTYKQLNYCRNYNDFSSCALCYDMSNSIVSCP